MAAQPTGTEPERKLPVGTLSVTYSYVVRSNAAKARSTRRSVSKIANAKTYRSELNGKYVSSSRSSAPN